jgi:hypothetical protein
VRGEALLFAIFFALAYAALATTFFTAAPRLFRHLDQLFDADLGVWAVTLTRPGARLPHYMVHPLITLFLVPWGVALRELLRWGGVHLAGRLAAALLCALAGGATVGAFRLLLERLGVRTSRARAFTLVFALSATQLVFSSLPETHAFSALGLVLVFLVSAPPRRSLLARVAAGVFSFGVTATGLVAVAFTHLDWRRDGRRAPVVAGRAVVLVLLVAVTLALVQMAVFPGARPFFVWEPLGTGYTTSVVPPSSLPAFAERTVRVSTHMAFVGLAAPRVTVTDVGERESVSFGPTAVPPLRPAGVVHVACWGVLLVLALWGLRRVTEGTRSLLLALLGWLAFVGLLHLFFGRSLFLFSSQWVFAVVALTAAGVESLAVGKLGERVILASVLLCVALQVVTNASLVAEVLRVFSRT